MLNSLPCRDAAKLALAVACFCVAFGGASRLSAAQPSTTVNGLRYDLVSAKRASTVGEPDETVRARETFVVLRFRISNQTRASERAFLTHAYLTDASGVKYRVASNATEALSSNTFAENTLQEVHPNSPIPVVIAFDVPADRRKLKLHILAHYPGIGTGGVMQLNV